VRIRRPEPSSWLNAGVLAALAYFPLFLSRPGKLSSDTFDGLYVNPARTLSQAASRWDSSTSLGTLADRSFNHAFPMSLWYRGFDLIGVPVWVAQRLWMGSLLMLAGLGVLFLLSVMEWEGRGKLVAAIAYQCSPYLLPYIGNRSVVLLTWAALPWLIAWTKRSLERPGWWGPAWFAIVFALVATSNPSALIYIGVGPLMWILYAVVATRDIPWRQGLAAVGRILLLCTAVALWGLFSFFTRAQASIDATWADDPQQIAVQASAASEVQRAMGEAHFYGSANTAGDTGEESVAGTTLYQTNPLVLVLTYVVPALALGAAAMARFRNRLFFVGLIAVGMVLGVGSSPAESPEPYGRLLERLVNTKPGPLLVPTHRAVALLALGVAVCFAAGVRRACERFPRQRDLTRIGAGVLAVITVPTFFLARSLDGSGYRPQELPDYWTEVGKALNNDVSNTHRVLELPGLDATDYVWGDTVAPITSAVTDRGVAIRRGQPTVMNTSSDLLRAFDDSIRTGNLSPEALAPMARLLNVGAILVRHDTVDDQALSKRIDDFVASSPGISLSRSFGEVDGHPAVNLYKVDESIPLLRLEQHDATIAVAGDGQGVVDLAQAGLLHNTDAFVMTGALHTPEQLAAATKDGPLIITDSNRWHRQVTGLDHTQGATERPGYLALDPPLGQPVVAMPGAADSAYSQADQVGVGSVQATSYGSRTDFWPQDRPVNAFDGDRKTAWRAGRNGGDVSAVGERIEVTLDKDNPHVFPTVRLRQPDDGLPYRAITQVAITFDGGSKQVIDLGPESRTGNGQLVPLTHRDPATRVDIEITKVDDNPTDAQRAGGSGFAEIGLPGVTAKEVIVLPADAYNLTGGDDSAHPLGILLTRWRSSSPGEEADPERRIVRQFTLPVDRTMTISGTARPVDPSVPVDTGCRGDLLKIDNRQVRVRLSRRDDGTYAITGCSMNALKPGEHTLETALPEVGGVTIDQLLLSSWTSAGLPIEPSSETAGDLTDTTVGATSFTGSIKDAKGSYWLVLGQSVDPGWELSLDGHKLGEPTLVNGFATGWKVDIPDDGAHTFSVRWAPQRPINLAVIVSAISLVVVAALALRRPKHIAAEEMQANTVLRYVHPSVVVLLVLGTFGIAAGAIPGLVAGVTALLIEQYPQLQRALAWVPVGLVGFVAVAKAVRQIFEQPAPGLSWVTADRWIDVVAWAAVALAVTVALANSDRRPVPRVLRFPDGDMTSPVVPEDVGLAPGALVGTSTRPHPDD
jgi:arabinofuranan 3-O-arabinosyltransferase